MKKGRNIFWGVILVLSAVCIFMNAGGMLPEIGKFRLVATIILAALLIKNIVVFRISGVILPLTLILCLYKGEIGFISGISTRTIFIVGVILAIGLGFLFGKNQG